MLLCIYSCKRSLSCLSLKAVGCHRKWVEPGLGDEGGRRRIKQCINALSRYITLHIIQSVVVVVLAVVESFFP